MFEWVRVVAADWEYTERQRRLEAEPEVPT